MNVEFWKSLWSVTWFAGVAIFTVLSVMITIYGAKDLTYLLRSLNRQHEAPPRDSEKP